MDLFTGSPETGSLKRTPGGIDGPLKCLRATTFEQPIHQAPAYPNLKKVLVDQALPPMGTLRVARFCKLTVQSLHEVVDLIPGAVFDEPHSSQTLGYSLQLKRSGSSLRTVQRTSRRKDGPRLRSPSAILRIAPRTSSGASSRIETSRSSGPWPYRRENDSVLITSVLNRAV